MNLIDSLEDCRLNIILLTKICFARSERWETNEKIGFFMKQTKQYSTNTEYMDRYMLSIIKIIDRYV